MARSNGTAAARRRRGISRAAGRGSTGKSRPGEPGDAETALRLPESLDGLIQVLADLLQSPVTLEDPRFRLLAYSRQPGRVDRARRDTILNKSVPAGIVHWLQESGAVDRLHRTPGPIQVPACPAIGLDERTAVAIRAGDRVLGHLWVMRQHHYLTEEDLRTLAQAATTAAVLLLRQEVEQTTQARLVREFLIDLIDGEGASEVAAQRRAEALGVELFDEFVTVVADIDAFERCIGDRDESWVQALKADLMSTIQSTALHAGERPLVLMRSDSVIVIVGDRRSRRSETPLSERSRRLAGALNEHLQRRFPALAFSIGVSLPLAGAESFPRAYRQATDAARVCRQFLNGARPAHYGDLGVYRLLRQIADLNRAEGYRNPHLERLEAYDRAHRTSLLPTLETYLDAFGDVEACAATLNVHPNTLRYRIGRIRRIGGVDLSDPAVRLTVHLELKLRQLVANADRVDSPKITPLS